MFLGKPLQRNRVNIMEARESLLQPFVFPEVEPHLALVPTFH
jgi:hypothetical protein